MNKPELNKSGNISNKLLIVIIVLLILIMTVFVVFLMIFNSRKIALSEETIDNTQTVSLNELNTVDIDNKSYNTEEENRESKVETDTIIITILSAIPGSKYEDTAISEIEIFGE